MNQNKIKIAMIVAYDNNYAIGANENIIASLPAHNFLLQELVKNNVVIMGRNTYLNTYNNLHEICEVIVVSDDDSIHDSEHVHCFDNIDDAMFFAEDIRKGDIYILGGESIFEQYFHFVDYIYLTKIDAEIDGADKFFNCEISDKEFKAINANKHYDNGFSCVQYLLTRI